MLLKTHFARTILAVIAVSILAGAQVTAAERPNVVVIVADDLGWADVGYHGGNIDTPSLDRLAEQGVQLNRFYTTPICSPTRAALMTGRDPMRLGVAYGVIMPWDNIGVNPAEHFMPESFGAAGYQTAMVGKWHLGHAQMTYHPNERGFEHFYGHLHTEVGFYPPFANVGGKDFQVNGVTADDEGYETYLLADEVSRYIRERDTQKPFFIYILPIIILFLGIALWSQLQFKIIKPILIVTLPTLLAVGSWAFLNKQNTGYATLSSYFGYNLAQQSVNFIHKAPDEYATVRDIYVEQIEKDKEQLGYTYYSIWDAYQPMMKATGYNFYDLSNELSNMSKTTIIANPKDYIKQVFLSWKLFWGVKLYWDQSHISNPTIVIVYKGIWFLQRPLIILGKILFVGLFLWSFIKGVLRKRISLHLLSFIFALVILGSILQAAIIYSDNYRFSFPYLPAIIIVLASYSVRLTQLIRKKK